MAAVKSKNTTPEMAVRRLAHSLGYRYRLHYAGLTGKPDMVFPVRRAVIFVHGCFWHGHNCKRGARVPKTNTAYWKAKICGNVTRDVVNINAIRSDGWRVLVIWECQTKDQERLKRVLRRFLER